MRAYAGHGKDRGVTVVANEESFEYAARHLNDLTKSDWTELYEMYRNGATMKEFAEWFFQNWTEIECREYCSE